MNYAVITQFISVFVSLGFTENLFKCLIKEGHDSFCCSIITDGITYVRFLDNYNRFFGVLNEIT